MAGPSSSLESDGYEQIKVFQDRIADKVRNGISPLQERRQFIRYLDRLSSSRRFTPAERRRFRLEAVDTYSRLGEHRRAAWEYARIANEDTNDWVALQGLAREYELAGEEKQALGIYLFMEGRLKDSVVNNVYRPIIAPNITRLKGVARDCPLKKPDW